MSTEVEYNGVLMEAVRTRTWQRTVERTPDRTDHLCAHYVGEWDLTLSRDENSYNASGVVQTGFYPRQSWDNIKQKLEARAKTLKIWIGGGQANLFFQSPANGFDCDARNGPIPMYARINRIDAEGGMLISFGIETWKDEKVTAASQPLRSNRWQMSHDIDGVYLTVIRWNGQAIFGADLLDPGQSPDNFRTKFWPPVPKRFHREQAHLDLSPDNRIITYNIVDREQVLVLGKDSPATKITGTYTTIMDLGGSSTSQPIFGGHVNLRAVGPKDVTREQLVLQAMRLALTKLDKDNNAFVNMIYSCRITYAWEARMIELDMAAKFGPPPTAMAGVMPDWRMNGSADLDDIRSALSIYGGGGVSSIMPPYPQDNGARGTFIEKLRAQILRDDSSQSVPLPPQL